MPETKTPQQRRRERRKAVRLIKADLLHDINIVEAKLQAAEKAKNRQSEKAYRILFDILYAAYCDVVDSEV